MINSNDRNKYQLDGINYDAHKSRVVTLSIGTTLLICSVRLVVLLKLIDTICQDFAEILISEYGNKFILYTIIFEYMDNISCLKNKTFFLANFYI